MSKTGKVLQVLRLFSEQRQQLRVDEVAQSLGVSPATAYRYVQDLAQAGFIESPSLGLYVLGPTIVELDRQIRMHDPLIAAARDILKTLADRTGGTALLARLHGRQVVCVDQLPGRQGPGHVSYERGRAMPLYRGATSVVILAHLDRPALRALVEQDGPGLQQAGLPTKFEALARHLDECCVCGIVHTQGAIDPGVLGWAAPVFHGKQLLGSLSVLLASDTPALAPERIADQLRRAALRVQGRLDTVREQQPVR